MVGKLKVLPLLGSDRGCSIVLGNRLEHFSPSSVCELGLEESFPRAAIAVSSRMKDVWQPIRCSGMSRNICENSFS